MKTNKKNNNKIRKTKKIRITGGESEVKMTFGNYTRKPFSRHGWVDATYEGETIKKEEFEPHAIGKLIYPETNNATNPYKIKPVDRKVLKGVFYINEEETLIIKGILTYRDGEIYEGDFKSGLRDGKGKMTYANGDTYEGDWKLEQRVGEGELRTNDGTVLYKGHWKRDKPFGLGKISADKIYEENKDKNFSDEDISTPMFFLLSQYGYKIEPNEEPNESGTYKIIKIENPHLGGGNKKNLKLHKKHKNNSKNGRLK